MTFLTSFARCSIFLLLVPVLLAGNDHHHEHHHGDDHEHHGHHEEHHHDEMDNHDHHGDDHEHHGHHEEHHHAEVHSHDHHHGHHDEHHHGHDHHDHHHEEHHGGKDDHRHEHHKQQQHAGPKNVDGWMGAYLSATAMSLVSFVGVVFLAIFGGYGRVEAMAEYVCLAFAGTVLVADALLHLLPHAFEGASHEAQTMSGLAAVVGALTVLVVPEMCSHGHSHGHGKGEKSCHDGAVAASGWANLFVEMLHNFVDGISIGLSWMAGTPAGLSASLAVAVHELPQELGDFVVLRTAGFSTKRLLFWNFLASLTCVGGVGVAHYLGQEASQQLQQTLMAFTAGSFLTLALNMIFPQVSESIRHHHTGKHAVFAKILCLFVSFLAVIILIKIGSLEGHDHEDGHSHGHGHGHSHGHSHSHSHPAEL